MRPLRVLWSKIAGVFRGRQLDRDMREQIEAHLEEAAEEYVRQGMPPTDARRRARLELGGVVKTEEACRDVRFGWYQDLAKDFGYGLRTLRRNPGFAAIAILSLAIGIGANSAIFSIVNSMLLRPRPLSNPEQLVELFTGEPSHPYEGTSYPSYLDLRQRHEVFTGLAAYGIDQFRLGDTNVQEIWGEVVSGNYFDVLGVTAHRGRTFLPEEDVEPGRNPVVVISYGLWQRRFNAAPALIGQTITINGVKLTVVGVAPPNYTGMFGGIASELWLPAMMMPAVDPANGGRRLTSRGSRWIIMVGRLQPAVTIAQARARFDVLSREMQAAHPQEWKARQQSGRIRELFVSVLPERDTRVHPQIGQDAYAIVALVFAIVNLILLIACLNLAGMLLARAVVRRKEIGVRLALGAGRFRIIRQLLAESVLLSLIAGVVGGVIGLWALDLLLAFTPEFPEGIRVAIKLQLDWRVVAYTVAFSTLTGVLFGLAPALQSSKTDLSATLKDDASALAVSYRRSRIRAALIVGQIALSLLLLIAAGLVLRSLENVRPTRLGFNTDDIVVAMLNLNEARYDRRRSQAFYAQLSERVAALPGVEAVSLVGELPGGFLGASRRGTEIEGYQPAPGERLEIDATFAGPRYFTNMGIAIVQGREFDDRDREGAPCVAVINEAFQRRYYPSLASPIGKHLAKFEGAGKTQCAIVGVARDDQWHSLSKAARPYYWLAAHQAHRLRMTLLARTAGAPAMHVAPVRRVLQEIDPLIPVNEVHTVGDYFGSMAYPFRLLGFIIGACGVMALVLAIIGIYGSVSYSVAQRTREVGVRMALGAMPMEILRMIAGQGMAPVVWGLSFGLLLSIALTRVLTSSLFPTELLFGIAASDPLTFAGVTLLLALVALVACSVPALRATKVNPVEALRYE